MSTDRAHKNQMIVPGAIIHLREFVFWSECEGDSFVEQMNGDECMVMFVHSVMPVGLYDSVTHYGLPHNDTFFAITGRVMVRSTETGRAAEYAGELVTVFTHKRTIVKAIVGV